MSLPLWDDGMKLDLLRLRSELRPDSFRVLHSPIGFAASPQSDRPDDRLIARRPALTPSASDVRASASQTSRQTTKPRPKAKPGGGASLPSRSLPSSPLRRNLTKVFLVHVLDIVFVVLTLALGIVFASWLIDPSHAPTARGHLEHAAPLRFVFEAHLYVLVLGLYGFFSVYWLFFKLVTGSTLGETFLDNFRTLQNPPGGAPAKDSGDS